MQVPTIQARFVFWKDDGDFPLFRTVAVTPGLSLALADMPWLVDACDDIPFTALEVYSVGRAMWRVKTLENGRLRSLQRYPTTLIRLAGVEDCPLFGLELENIYRCLGYPAMSHNIPEEDCRVDTYMRALRVVTWRDNGEDPIVHIINFSSDNWVCLYDFNSVVVDLDDRVNVFRYDPEDQDWHLQSLMYGFYVEPEYDSLLLKFTEVTITIGFGREVEEYAKLYQPQEGFGDAEYPTSYKTIRNLAMAICPALDVMTADGFDYRSRPASSATLDHTAGVPEGEGELARRNKDKDMVRVERVAPLARTGLAGQKRSAPDESGPEDTWARGRRARYE